MKRFLLAAAALGLIAALAVLVRQADTQISQTTGGRGSEAVYWVVASNFVGPIRGGPNTLLCDGTDDHIQIQQGATAADVLGGKVKLSQGTFYYGQPAGETVVEGTASVYAYVDGVRSDDVCGATFETYGTGAYADLAVGQIYRVWGGDDGEGKSLEDNYEPLISSVEYVTPNITLAGADWQNVSKSLTEIGAFATAAIGDRIILTAGTGVTTGVYEIATIAGAPDTVTLTADINGAGGDIGDTSITSVPGVVLGNPVQENYGEGAETDCDIKRMVGAVKITGAGVTIQGSGINSTFIQRAAGADCAAFIHEGGTPAAAVVYTCLRDFTMYGTTGGSYDGDQAGIVIGRRCYDPHLEMLGIFNLAGEGVVVSPWGLKWMGGWVEYCDGMGAVINKGNQGSIASVKFQSNSGDSEEGAATMPAVLLRYTDLTNLNAVWANHGADYAIRFQGAIKNSIVGSTISTATGGAATGCIAFGSANGVVYSSNNSIVGSYINCQVAKTIGVFTSQYNYNQTIVGCSFSTATTTPLSLYANTNTTIRGCNGVGDVLDCGLSIQTCADDAAITVRSAIVRVVSSEVGVAVLDADPAIVDGYADGQVVRIVGTDDAKPVDIRDNCNVQLTGGAAAVLGVGDFVTVVWNAALDDWYESSRGID